MLPLVILLGTLALVGLVLVVTFAAIRRALDRAAAALAPEGIERDSGQTTVSVRMRGFRAPGLYVGGGIRRVPGRIVLTKQRLHILGRPQRYGIIDRAELGRFTVGIHEGRLHLVSEDPPGASGSVDYRAAVPEVDAWVAALTAAGARAA